MLSVDIEKQLGAFRIHAPDEQTRSRQVSVGTDALTVLEQQVFTVLAVETVYRACPLHRLEVDGRVRLLNP